MPEQWQVTCKVPSGTGAPTVKVYQGVVSVTFPADVIGTPIVAGPQSVDDEPVEVRE